MTIDNTPRVWAGCEHCYVNGALIGDWFDISDALDLDCKSLHEHVDVAYCGGDEVSFMDTDNLPTNGEPSYQELSDLVEAWTDCNGDDELWALWCVFRNEVGGHALPSDLECEAIEVSSPQEYYCDLAHDTLLNDVDDSVARYFDYDKWASDCAEDFHELYANGKTYLLPVGAL